MSARASVIVPAYNAASTLAACLAALQDQLGPAGGLEIIVVDDGSTDGTATVAYRYPVRLLAQPHRGAAAARNLGARAAEGDILLFTDADCRPREQWAERMLAPFADPAVAGVKGFFGSDQHSLVARLVQAEYEEKEAHMLAQQSVAFADTAAAGYRAAVFRELGGFRTDMRAVEDTEFAFRLAASGYKIVVAPEAVVLHRHPEGVAQYARRKLRYGIWGAWAYARFPSRVANDSRTPRSMRLQLVLAPLLAMSVLAAAFGVGGAGAVAVALGLGFVATVAPFAWRVRADPAVAAIAPAMFLVRALAVSTGLAIGLARALVHPLSPSAPPERLEPERLDGRPREAEQVERA